MAESWLEQITYVFPQNSPETVDWLATLAALLEQDPAAETVAPETVLVPRYPAGARPFTALALDQVSYPALRFEHDTPIDLSVGRFRLYSRTAPPPPGAQNMPMAPIQATEQAMPLPDLARRLEGHVQRVDHTGVELPSHLVSREVWDALVRDVARMAATYRYPEGHDWPFILPANEEELRGDITQFEGRRAPKFELTYGYVEWPLIQFHLDTDLPRAELETLVPEPYGFALPGVETFRSVMVAHPWPDLAIRFDLTFRSDEGLSEWDSGRWLVQEGGRIR